MGKSLWALKAVFMRSMASGARTGMCLGWHKLELKWSISMLRGRAKESTWSQSRDIWRMGICGCTSILLNTTLMMDSSRRAISTWRAGRRMRREIWCCGISFQCKQLTIWRKEYCWWRWSVRVTLKTTTKYYFWIYSRREGTGIYLHRTKKCQHTYYA